MRERERERENDRDKDREKETETQRERQRQTDTETDIDRMQRNGRRLNLANQFWKCTHSKRVSLQNFILLFLYPSSTDPLTKKKSLIFTTSL